MNRILHYILLFTALLTSSARAQVSAPVINIVHTNDTHSQIEPAVNRQGVSYGGVVERAAMLELLRQQDPDLLYLDAGDMVQGSPYFNIFKGELEMLCMNQQQLLATTFGNHEFDNGIEGVLSMLQVADFPIISCNYHCEGTALEARVLPHLIVENHGVRIGITGATCTPEGLIAQRNWEGIRYEDPSTAVNREAALLRREGCDVVILLSHVGYLPAPEPGRDEILDTDIAAASHDVDLIIGAHTHVNIERGTRVNNADNRPVVITQTGGKANPIGHLQIVMKPGSRYPECRYSVDSIVCRKLHPGDYDLTGLGAGIAEIVEPYRESLSERMNVSLATASMPLERSHPQCRLGNFTADALLQIGQELGQKPVDASIMNLGGLRNELAAGSVTIGSLYNIFPFENAVVLLDLYGRDLQELINSNAGRKLDCWAGTQITLQMDGDRCYASDVLVGGQPIDPDRLYRICTIDYLAEGNGGMSALTRAASLIKTGVTIRDAMIGYVTRLGQQGKAVEASIDGRVIDLTK